MPSHYPPLMGADRKRPARSTAFYRSCFRRGGQGRNLLVACACILFLWWFLSSPWSFESGHGGGRSSSSGASAGRGEWVQLERFMNRDAGKAVKTTKSSFDWSSIKFRYPAGKPRPLPSSGAAGPLPRVQFDFQPETAQQRRAREARRDQVRAVFRKAWASYRKYAWMKDALQPLSAGFKDQFSGWAATLVDSLDTLWIMGLRDEFDEAVEAVASIDFGHSSSGRVNTFETNIRYLGGLLAAYDLSRRPVLLAKATELGDLLYAGFNTVNRMPVDFIDFHQAKTGDGLTVEGQVVSASPGTLSMEFAHLSQVTGDAKYYDAVARITDLFYRGQNKTKLPGMWPIYVSMSTEDVTSGAAFSLGSYADSLYEYLPKMHALLGGGEPAYAAMTRGALDTARRHLLFRPMLPAGEDILIAGNVNVDGDDGRPSLDPESEHLACFTGGMYALAGRLLGRDDYVSTGAKLALGCAYAYKSMPTGMMPERFNMVACPSETACRWDEAVWDREKRKRPEWKEHLPLGFTTAKDPRYILRPEAIESLFVLYRVTGRPSFQDAAWEMFEAVSKGTATEYANAAVLDVTTARAQLPQEDYMESFWLAETMKYFYLAFCPPDIISLDDFVLNTEAHPFRRPT